MAATLGNFVFAEFEPILALRLKDYNASTIQTGMCLSIYGFVYIIGTIAMPYVPERISKRFILMFSCFFMGIFLFLVGPSQLLGFRESLLTMVIGLFLTANFLAPLAIPVLPEMQEATMEKFPNFDSQQIGNYNGALFSSFLGLGQVLGPLFGASTYAALNFRLTQDIMALICIVFAVLYFFCADGKSAIIETF